MGPDEEVGATGDNRFPEGEGVSFVGVNHRNGRMVIHHRSAVHGFARGFRVLAASMSHLQHDAAQQRSIPA
jgi:hypothetical protein